MLYRFSGCFPFYPILPTVYTEALSYYEEICLLNSRINDIIKQMDDYGESVLNESKSYTDEQITSLRLSLTEMIKQFGNQYQGQIDDLNEKYIELNLSIVKLFTMWSDYQNIMDSRFDLMKKDLENYIKEVVSDINRLYVINPTNGKYQPIQQVLNDMYNALSWGSLTARQYDDMQLSAKYYDNREITAYDYDHFAHLKFFHEIYLRMLSPFTGQMDSYESIIYRLVDFHKENAITANAYDTLDLTATEYDTKNITAYDYDFNAKTLLGG